MVDAILRKIGRIVGGAFSRDLKQVAAKSPADENVA
jgi:hypothetical protein